MVQSRATNNRYLHGASLFPLCMEYIRPNGVRYFCPTFINSLVCYWFSSVVVFVSVGNQACPPSFSYALHHGFFCCASIAAVNDNGGLVDHEDTLDKCESLQRDPCPLLPEGRCYSESLPQGKEQRTGNPTEHFAMSEPQNVDWLRTKQSSIDAFSDSESVCFGIIPVRNRLIHNLNKWKKMWVEIPDLARSLKSSSLSQTSSQMNETFLESSDQEGWLAK